MPPRRVRNTIVSWITSAAVHLAAWGALSWSFSRTGPELSLEISNHSGEISSVLTSVAAENQVTEASEFQPEPQAESLIAEASEAPEVEEAATPPATSAAWADARLSHRPIVVRERLPRTVALANLDPLARIDPPSSVPAKQHPKDLPPICQELWRKTTELPRQIDFDAMEQLLQKVAAPTIAVIETDAAVESTASAQGATVDILPEPGPKNRPPAYPSVARLAGQSGRVLLTVVVAVEGGAKDVRISQSSGHPVLDDAALAAVRTWTFTPARRNGETVELEIDVPIRFRLTQ